jgi:hypothetical protein
MGSGSSVQVIKTVEVSFVDDKTAKLLPNEKITEINEKIFKEFDYKQSFYDAYKIDKTGNNPYAKCAEMCKISSL